jgi:uncharacterized membrane protein
MTKLPSSKKTLSSGKSSNVHTSIEKTIVSDTDSLIETIDELPPATKERVVSHVMAAYYEGPIPPASELAKYQKILPDAPERILRMAEKEQDLKIHMNKRFDAYKTRGQIFALFCVAITAALAAYLAKLGYPALGSMIFGGTLATIVCAFIYGKRKDSNN